MTMSRASDPQRRMKWVASLCAWAVICAAGVSPLLPACQTRIPPPVPSASTCAETLGLFATADALADANDPCRDWVDITYGRVAASGNASAVLWTRRTAFATAVLVSAMHTRKSSEFAPAGADLAEALHDPTTTAGVSRLTLIAPEGGRLNAFRSALFDLYNPEVPAAENTPGFFDILPRHDFFLAVVDGQEFDPRTIPAEPPTLTKLPVRLFDPRGLTETVPSFTDAQSGERLLMIGYPSSAPFRGAQAASVGRVLSDAEARSALEELKLAGDVEGDIPYDSAAELLLEGEARGGMSGGGVFDDAGRLVGILVRASDPHDGGQLVRVVRMTFIARALDDALGSASEERRAAATLYVEALEDP